MLLNALQTGLSIGFALVSFVVFLVVVVFLSMKVSGWAIQFQNWKRARKNAAEFNSRVDDFFKAMADAGPIQPPPAMRTATDATPEVGHYIKDCKCDRCQYAEAHGGLDLSMYYNLDTYELNADGITVATQTAPIETCTCKFCQEAREVRFLSDKPLAVAHEIRASLNQLMGYAL